MKMLRPGMLCMLYGFTVDVAMNGKTVELDQFVHPGQNFSDPIEPGIRYYSGFDESTWVCIGDFPRGPKNWGLVASRHLMPLEDPDADFEDGKLIYGVRQSSMMSQAIRSIKLQKSK